MHAFFVSIVSVGLAEIGDRSMFFALLLGVRYRRPWPVFFGMTLGLASNQLISAVFGSWFFSVVAAKWLPWIIGAIFLGMAVWVLIPDDEDPAEKYTGRSIFATSAISFFLLEMADKTQIAVMTLAGAFQTIIPVVLGATLGILLITTPALWLGHRFSDVLPIKKIRIVSALIFLLLGVWMIGEGLGWLPQISAPTL